MPQATGTVVVIDVIRAFTTAAFAFAAGAVDITFASTVQDALALREHTPGALVMGVDGGRAAWISATRPLRWSAWI
jgi:2-phosphosulfolactate phosphatase